MYHTSTHTTPYKIVHGYNLILKCDIHNCKNRICYIAGKESLDDRETSFMLAKKMSECLYAKKDQLSDKASISKMEKLKPGVPILVRLPMQLKKGEIGKFKFKWLDGFEIVRQVGNSYMVKRWGKEKPRKIHINHIKLDSSEKEDTIF
uniref:Retrovirus-related Pol polyprotein from transposon TNT 1-94 n=1 Tax=Strongyloides venezuelensis TaxID=75913 RepID=A0A0K0FRM4_STRVS